MKNDILDKLLANPNLRDGSVFWYEGERPRCGGGIVSARNYDGRVTFTFTWAAAKTKRGWTARALLVKSLEIGSVVQGENEHEFVVGDNIVIYLKGHGKVTQNEVVPKYTRHDRELWGRT